MCGIISIFDIVEDVETLRKRTLKMARTICHKGPDWSGVYVDEGCVMAHERLAIVDPESGSQPLHDIKNQRVLAVNGEIYDHKELRKKLTKKHDFQTKSDCEVLLYLYDELGVSFLDHIDGIFAFSLYDKKTGEVFVARDHIGIIPLYIGWDIHGQTYVASELKALDGVCEIIKEFPPGHYYLSSEKEFVRWYKRDWMEKIPEEKVDLTKLKTEMEEAVKRQLMSDVPFGLLISGGLDSSVIAAIAQKYSDEKLHSFSIGLEGSPDLFYAKKVADYLGTKHHSITYTIEEGFDAIRDVIRHIETFDVTTIRASTPMYLLARKIRSYGIKMVLSGEGADEVFGGYLYFHMAPSKKEFHEETVRKLLALSKYDCLRANKSLAAWGIEGRVPFLDKYFLDYAMSIDPEDKMCSKMKKEKWIVREALKSYLPEEIIWRQKEQFSDGVGYGWIDYLKDYAEKTVSDEMLKKAKFKFPVKTPLSKEEYVYRTIFEETFASPSAVETVPVGPSVACSTPTAIAWSKQFEKADPSGRAVRMVHEHAVK
ncbi:asparagine synthase B [Candidatus Woesearchaeota archaeon]|nr:asparagine synthase B [Candidatus Woesearchaeota archaeon]